MPGYRAILLSVTLVLLTPIGLDAGCWSTTGLLDDGAVAHEFPGFGARPRSDATPTMATLADEIASSYAGQLDVVGVSMGGMVGQHVAARHPDRVRSLLVACTGAAANREVMLARASMAEAEGMAGVLQSTLERWFTPTALAMGDEHPGVAYALRTLLALDPAAFADGWRAIAGHDVRDRLPLIRARVTALAGAQDAASPLSRSEEIAERVPGARLTVLDGPHMMHLERPDAFATAVRAHLRWGREP